MSLSFVSIIAKIIEMANRGLVRSKEMSRAVGCGYLLKLTVLISLLMIANSYLVGQLVQANVQYVPDVFDDVRLYQFFQIFVPILMVCVQFWMYDRIRDAWIRNSPVQ